ncbi:MAG: hypothetical protein NVSMB42_12330 [Herpetosiphon sp.]
MKHANFLAAGALMLLAACGPAQAGQTASDAASVVSSAVPGADRTAVAALSAVSSAVPGADRTAAAAVSAIAAVLPAGSDQTAAAIANDPTLQALLSESVTTIQGLVPTDLRLDKNQGLVLNTTKQVADVTDYRWVITEVPKGAESVRGKQIGENSNGKLTIDPGDYAKYFPVAGRYNVDLELTYSSGKKEIAPIPITVP